MYGSAGSHVAQHPDEPLITALAPKEVSGIEESLCREECYRRAMRWAVVSALPSAGGIMAWSERHHHRMRGEGHGVRRDGLRRAADPYGRRRARAWPHLRA